MESDFITLTPENLADEQLCCIVRRKKGHSGIEAKRAWLAERLKEGHVFRKLAGDECAFIEYAPLETAWVPVVGERYLYIYCLWVQGAPRGHGYGKRLMESCIDDARARGLSGVCMLGAKKQKSWLSDQSFAKKYGFQTVDTAGEYELLALSLDGVKPRFSESAKKQTIDCRELTVYYDDQCPFISGRVEKLGEYCSDKGIPLHLVHVDSLDAAKTLPCVFNNWAVFVGGKLVTINQIDGASAEKLIKKIGS